MKQASNQRTKKIVIGLTVVLFILGYMLVAKAGISDARQLFGFLIASYLVVWGGYALVTAIPREEIRNQFVLTTFSLGMALAMLELPVALKLINYRTIFAITDGFDWEHPAYLPDLELLYKPKPHQTLKMQVHRGNIGEVLCLPPHPEEPFDLIYDKNGFRNEEDLTSADIAVIGDSYVESQMMPGSLLATTRLAELTKLTVANLGQSGYGPQQELVVLKRHGLSLRPKTVVWVFYEGNDLLDARAYANQVASLKATWGRVDSFWYRSFTKNSLAWMTRSLRTCVPNQNEKPQAARTTVLDSEGNKHKLYVKGRSVSITLTKQELDDLQKTVSVLEEAHRLVQEEGARLMVVFAPVAYRVYHEITDFEGVGGGATRWDVNDLPDRLRGIVAEISSDIDYLDLTPALRSAARNNTMVFLDDDTHWTAEGHRVVAEALAEALTARKKSYAKLPMHERSKKPTVRVEDVLLVRNLDGTIRYWSKGAQKLYGWEPHEVLGEVSHQLLKTVFPIPIEVIEEELRVKGHWEGRLVHERRDGSKVAVASQWDLQQNPKSPDQSITIVEVSSQTDS
ncbi:MAG: hypothetical protein Nkreftii_001431 [Candidatus Nitrospira kreftii]|uniref:PAS domain-containing protein n=1 Tax=Candidatus Nitrospira kreftii TaxID=2652173 RepID=A0A7S8FD50_9BACT|nr:MAG: hypothetical protein Nkreftii_001431 [Candidatus Nitrospira kreftii]